MEKMIQALLPYIRREVTRPLVAIPFYEEDSSYGLYFSGDDERIAEVVLTETGQLRMFTEIEAEEFEARVTKEDILQMTASFIKDLYPQESSKLHLSAVMDMDDFYWIDYVQLDPQYKLELPNSGVSFYVFKSGVIMDMSNHMERFALNIPVTILDKNEAKDIYLRTVEPQLMIKQYDKDTYIQGNDEFKLVFDFVNTTPIDVKMDGSITTLCDLGIENEEYVPISTHKNKVRSLYEWAGVNTMEKVSERVMEDGIMELWSHFDFSDLALIHEEEDLWDQDYWIEEVVKVLVHSDGGHIMKIVRTMEFSGKEILDEGYAYESALHILFSQFTEADQQFKLKKENHALTDCDEEGEELPPYAYSFLFNRFEQNILIENEYVLIIIDAESGGLLQWCTTEHVYLDFSPLVKVTPNYGQVAFDLFKNAFTMELHWSRDINDDQTVYYDLTYLPEFCESRGSIHCIEAESLKPWIVDTSSLEECT